MMTNERLVTIADLEHRSTIMHGNLRLKQQQLGGTGGSVQSALRLFNSNDETNFRSVYAATRFLCRSREYFYM